MFLQITKKLSIFYWKKFLLKFVYDGKNESDLEKFLEPPVFTREPQDLQAYLGSVIELQCAATGVPPASISWFHNGLPLRDDIQR